MRSESSDDEKKVDTDVDTDDASVFDIDSDSDAEERRRIRRAKKEKRRKERDAKVAAKNERIAKRKEIAKMVRMMGDGERMKAAEIRPRLRDDQIPPELRGDDVEGEVFHQIGHPGNTIMMYKDHSNFRQYIRTDDRPSSNVAYKHYAGPHYKGASTGRLCLMGHDHATVLKWYDHPGSDAADDSGVEGQGASKKCKTK